MTQFVLGVYDNGGYIDSFSVIAWRSVTSVTGFWFDCVTSIPWSCIDLHLYLVRHCGALCTASGCTQMHLSLSLCLMVERGLYIIEFSLS